MSYDPKKHHRRSIRLQGYDYRRAGAYYVTICTQDHRCLLGQIEDATMHLSEAGRMIEDIWHALPEHYPGVALDAFVLMPNHLHGLILLTDEVPPPDAASPADAAPPRSTGIPPWMPPTAADGPQNDGPARGPQNDGPARGPAPTARLSLPEVVHRFKSLTTARYRHGVHRRGWTPFPGRLWQRNYWEHIVRDEGDLARIRRYIAENPARWRRDRLRKDR